MKIFKIILFISVLIGLAACDDGSEFETIETSYVAFSASSVSISEASSVTTQDGNSFITNSAYEATIYRSTSDLNSDLTVDFSVTGIFNSTTEFAEANDDASSTFQVSEESGSILIPAGSAFATITVTSLNDLFSSGDKIVTLTLTGTSDSNIELGFSKGAQSDILVITISDDDCPISIPDTWAGFYEVTSFEAAPGSFNDGFGRSDAIGFKTEIIADDTDPTGTSVILKGGTSIDGSTSLFRTDVPMVFDTCPMTVLIGPDVYEINLVQNSATATIFRADEPQTFGNGTFKEDGSGFTLTVSYGNVSGANFDEFNVVFERVADQ